jgi:hypothetical protein
VTAYAVGGVTATPAANTGGGGARGAAGAAGIVVIRYPLARI